MMVSEKRLCPSTKISHTVSCNISLYRDTKEVIYRYTQNVYRCISNKQSSYTLAFMSQVKVINTYGDYRLLHHNSTQSGFGQTNEVGYSPLLLLS